MSCMRLFQGWSLVMLSVFLLAPAASAVTIYTDRTQWESAVAGFVTETFDTTIGDATSITLDNGIVSTAYPGLNRNGLNNVDSNSKFPGKYVGRVGITNHPQYIEWILPAETIGFFADVGDVNTGGLILAGYFDDPLYNSIDIDEALGITSGYGGGGFGIVGDSTFGSLRWDTGNESELFHIDNLSLASMAIPEPSAALVFGLGALLVCSRKR